MNQDQARRLTSDEFEKIGILASIEWELTHDHGAQPEDWGEMIGTAIDDLDEIPGECQISDRDINDVLSFTAPEITGLLTLDRNKILLTLKNVKRFQGESYCRDCRELGHTVGDMYCQDPRD